MPQDKRKRKRPEIRVGKVDIGTTASRAAGAGRPKSAAEKLLKTGNIRQKYEAARVLMKSKGKRGKR